MFAESLQYPELADRDLALRPLSTDAIEWITAACQEPAIPRWTTIPRPYERHHAAEYVAESAAKWSQQAGLRLIVTLDGRRIGMVGLERREPGAAEIGYWISAAGRGHRAATRAARLMADWGFNGPWKLDTIRLLTVVGNVASQRCCELLGAERGPAPECTVTHAGGPWWAYTWTLAQPGHLRLPSR
ncbi:MAG: GNAT family N-acetyltransferase [Thermoleophilia bacterium]|nr:GNAT family N-acetyltransferase [Thermoleophilia bacterium]